MEDRDIIELYFQRDESAVAETKLKYEAYCRKIAGDLLPDDRDAEECVSEAFFRAWTLIPPERPERLRFWLGAVVRSIALNMLKANRTQKRGGGAAEALDELAEAVPSGQNVEREVEDREVGRAINRWLGTLSKADRQAFVRRYWHGLSLNELAAERNESAGKLAVKMYRLRRDLKSFLEKEEQFHE